MLVAAWCDFESACDIYLLKKKRKLTINKEV